MENHNYKTALRLLIQSIIDGNKHHEYFLEVGMTPPVLQNVGLPKLPLLISGKIIDKCHFEHGVTEATLCRLYDLIANPLSVYKSDSPHIDHQKVNAVMLVTIETKDGSPLLVAIHGNNLRGRDRVNLIKSMYTKKEAVIQKWRNNGLLMWDRPATPTVQATVTQIRPTTITTTPPVIVMKKKKQFTKD